jgi:ubiquinone/menaquinone biosynthesis C-methylase UbiE
MSTDVPPQGASSYVIDAEDAAEMARLVEQDRLLTRGMGGIFPESPHLNDMNDILDIGCGPGGWVCDVAFEYPKIQVTGIDISRTMIEYARAMASVQGLDNAHFKIADALKPLEYPDASFDLVNARLISGFVPKTYWPALLQECQRVLRPGGVIRLTEVEFPITNSAAYGRLSEMCTRAMQVAQLTFSPDGRFIGITPLLEHFLMEVGCQDIQHKAHALNFSSWTPIQRAYFNNFMTAFRLLKPFLLKTKVTTDEEFEEVYSNAMIELMMEDFAGIWFYLTVWGHKKQGA